MENNNLKNITIYTDGACIGNPGPGGYGIILEYNNKKKEISHGYANTTNNRMELMATIIALEALNEKCKVVLYSDSKYVVDSIEKGWAENWKAKGWMRNKNDKALNADLWQRLLELLDKHNVKFQWVKGHDGHVENERCDFLATQAAGQSELQEDVGYKS